LLAAKDERISTLQDAHAVELRAKDTAMAALQSIMPAKLQEHVQAIASIYEDRMNLLTDELDRVKVALEQNRSLSASESASLAAELDAASRGAAESARVAAQNLPRLLIDQNYVHALVEQLNRPATALDAGALEITRRAGQRPPLGNRAQERLLGLRFVDRSGHGIADCQVRATELERLSQTGWAVDLHFRPHSLPWEDGRIAQDVPPGGERTCWIVSTVLNDPSDPRASLGAWPTILAGVYRVSLVIEAFNHQVRSEQVPVRVADAGPGRRARDGQWLTEPKPNVDQVDLTEIRVVGPRSDARAETQPYYSAIQRSARPRSTCRPFLRPS